MDVISLKLGRTGNPPEVVAPVSLGFLWWKMTRSYEIEMKGEDAICGDTDNGGAGERVIGDWE